MINEQAEAIKAYILNQVKHHPSDILAITARQFQVTRLKQLNFFFQPAG